MWARMLLQAAVALETIETWDPRHFLVFGGGPTRYSRQINS
jgi:hypothetical protein